MIGKPQILFLFRAVVKVLLKVEQEDNVEQQWGLEVVNLLSCKHNSVNPDFGSTFAWGQLEIDQSALVASTPCGKCLLH